jgi:hypothetical protein
MRQDKNPKLNVSVSRSFTRVPRLPFRCLSDYPKNTRKGKDNITRTTKHIKHNTPPQPQTKDSIKTKTRQDTQKRQNKTRQLQKQEG